MYSEVAPGRRFVRAVIMTAGDPGAPFAAFKESACVP